MTFSEKKRRDLGQAEELGKEEEQWCQCLSYVVYFLPIWCKEKSPPNAKSSLATLDVPSGLAVRRRKEGKSGTVEEDRDR